MRWRSPAAVGVLLAAVAWSGVAGADDLGFPGVAVSVGPDGGALVRTDHPRKLRLASTNGSAEITMPAWQVTVAAALDAVGGGVFLAGVHAERCRLALARIEQGVTTPWVELPDTTCVERWFALPGGGAAAIDRAGDAVLFDVAGRRSTHCRFAAPRGAHGGGIAELAISPDGAWIAALDRTGAIRGPGDRDRLLLCRVATGAVVPPADLAAVDASGVAWIGPADLVLFHAGGSATLFDAARGAALRALRSPAFTADRWTPLPSGRLAGTSASGAVLVDLAGPGVALVGSQRAPGWRYASVAGTVVRARRPSPARLELHWLDATLARVTHRVIVPLD